MHAILSTSIVFNGLVLYAIYHDCDPYLSGRIERRDQVSRLQRRHVSVRVIPKLLVPSHGHRNIPNHRQYDRLTTKTPNICITSRLWRNSPVTVIVPFQKVSNAKSVSMLWCHHVIVSHQHKFLKASLTGIFIIYIDLKINKFRLSCCKLHTEADVIFHLVLFCPNNMHTGEYTHDVLMPEAAIYDMV